MHQLSRLLTGFTLPTVFAVRTKTVPHTLMLARGHKNFGHGREPIPIISLLWHTFLTVSFISCGIEFKRIKNLIFPPEQLADDGGQLLASTNSDVIKSSPI